MPDVILKFTNAYNEITKEKKFTQAADYQRKLKIVAQHAKNL